jgi:hypothetical protein
VFSRAFWECGFEAHAMCLRRVVPVVALAAVAVVAASLWMTWGTGPANSATFSVGSQPLALIPPGTPIGDRAPEGWTRLVFKSYSELAAGDVRSLPDFAKELAEFLFTAMVARVTPVEQPGGQQGERRYRLDAVAIGVGTRIGRDDVIITSGTQAKLGAKLGPLKVVILSRAEEHLAKVRRVVVSDVLWVVDAPSVMFVEGANRNVVLRYAFLLNPSTGQLASAVWRIDLRRDGSYERAAGPAVLIQQDLVGRCPLRVDGRRIFAGIPTNDAFAATRLPQGTPFDLPKKILPLAAGQQLTAEAAREIEAALREEIVFPGSK